MKIAPRGRAPSLLAWGLLVGGTALLITLPQGAPRAVFTAGQIPAAFLFLLAGLVFGLSHPEGRDWAGAAVLGWVPLVAAVVALLEGPADPVAWIPVLIVPGALAAAGAWVGARFARRRQPTP